ncbi:uncharacterized protein Z520_08528 [Fonsecaea multimorphosa CBS 102226]|uniref:Uncharacterized protein n=1 Tax=Fonsecaea multimorphosa CBS 102226 TaxID=1442371 RepID=A0A0D2H1X6_9EURO|nr:uncharacterized protein Z520_08528 [Fonsecaea multimorphosa CBS 102226]KIX95820.1 hypothetical protein Z520_08528 [Fonsecaea multimorphosa CBS 102226]
MASRFWLYLLVLVCLTSTSAAAVHFKSWYGQFRQVFEHIMENDCQKEYQTYLQKVAPKDYLSEYVTPVIDCILENLNETRKSNMAAAAVLLGLLPTTLGLVGSTTVEVGLVALRRPFLAFLLAAGAPAVSPIRTFDYIDTTELLERKPKTIRIKQMGRPMASAYEVCVRTICSFAPETAYLPALWAFLTVAVHFFGTWSVYCRTRITTKADGKTPAGLWQVLCAEFTPSASRQGANLEIKEETYLYIFLSWFTATGTVLHIVYGTLVFSSLIFISTSDATTVVARYLSSTLVCRAIVMFELSGLREVLSERRKGSHSGPELIPMEPTPGTMSFGDRLGAPWKWGPLSRTDEWQLLRGSDRLAEA